MLLLWLIIEWVREDLCTVPTPIPSSLSRSPTFMHLWHLAINDTCWSPRTHWTSRIRQKSGLYEQEQGPHLWAYKPAKSEALWLGRVPCVFSLDAFLEVGLCSLCRDRQISRSLGPVFSFFVWLSCNGGACLRAQSQHYSISTLGNSKWLPWAVHVNRSIGKGLSQVRNTSEPQIWISSDSLSL